MKILKFLLWSFICFAALLAASAGWWYDYPETSLSFKISGDGEPYIDAVYNKVGSKQDVVSIYPLLQGEPSRQIINIKAATINDLTLKIKHYSGKLDLCQFELDGSQLDIPAGDEHYADGCIKMFMTDGDDVAVNICKDCKINKSRHLVPRNLWIMLIIGGVLFALALVFFINKSRIHQKLLNIYSYKNYARIMPYVKPYWFRAVLAILVTIPVGSMDAVIAWSLKPFMDVVLVERQSGWTMYIPLMIVVFSILQAVFNYIATYMNTWVGNKIALDVKRKLFNKLLHRESAFFDKADSGFILLRFNNDAESACSGLLNSMRLFSTRFFSSLSLIIVLFYNSWKLAIVAIIVLFGALLPLTQIRKKLKKLVTKDANVIATMLFSYNEVYNGNRVITAYNLFDYCRQKFIGTINNLFDLTLQVTRKTGSISPIMHTISSFGIAFVIWYGSYLIVSHQITVGNFASFITSLVMLYNPLKSIGNNAGGIVSSLMAVERVFQQIDTVPQVRNIDNAQKMDHCHGNISYCDVSFAYIKGKPVLKKINLEIKSGQTVALVGNSGGGKTTISALLPRFYDASEGEIKIDGINIKNFDLQSLRENISVVFQDNFLFGGTIRENILLGRQDVTDEQLAQAIKASCLDEFINKLERGLDTEIGERGVLLSGGQKQRVAIARAFVKNAPILILDEATSALDNKSEAIVQKAIDNLMKDRTVLVIAHRLSTVRNADRIVVINNGVIVQQGTHDELIAADGPYAALYKTQLG